jgi:hypothetical protein
MQYALPCTILLPAPDVHLHDTAVLLALYSPCSRYAAWPWSHHRLCPAQLVGHDHTVDRLLKAVLSGLKGKQAATATATALPATPQQGNHC